MKLRRRRDRINDYLAFQIIVFIEKVVENDHKFMLQALKSALPKFELEMRRGVLSSSYRIAISTVNLIKTVVDAAETEEEVEDGVKLVCRRLETHFPNNVIIGNVCQNINIHLAEELLATAPKPQQATRHPLSRSVSRSVIDILAAGPSFSNQDSSYAQSGLKTRVKEMLDNIEDELGESYDLIAANAHNFVVAGDIILTLGCSKSVVTFLSVQKHITVVLPERGPEYDGHDMAAKLRKHGIKVIVIPDSAVFAILPKISKIIVPARAVLANGGIVGYSLSHAIALAAKHYSTPFIVLYWDMKLTNTMPAPCKSFTSLQEPNTVMVKGDPSASNVMALNTEGDYVPPELITLMINESGAHCPADVFSRVQERYEN